MLKTNNPRLIRKDKPGKIGNQKNENISLARPSSVMRGRLTIFLALSEGLSASMGDEELTLPFRLLTALTVGWTCHYFISLWRVANGHQAVVAAEGILGFHHAFQGEGGPSLSPLFPPFQGITPPIRFDLFGLEKETLGSAMNNPKQL